MCLAAIGASFIVFTTASSTSFLALIAALGALALFPIRQHVRFMRWAALGILVMLQLLMENNVWHVLLRFGVLTGSQGYHRYWLIENCVRHFSDWALMGCSTQGWSGPSQYDVANNYVIQAVTGGLITLMLFLGLLVTAYRQVSSACRLAQADPITSWLVWCIGVALFVHSVSFVGLTYFGQLFFAWGLHIGLIGSLSRLAAASNANGGNDIEVSAEPALSEW